MGTKKRIGLICGITGGIVGLSTAYLPKNLSLAAHIGFAILIGLTVGLIVGIVSHTIFKQ